MSGNSGLWKNVRIIQTLEKNVRIIRTLEKNVRIIRTLEKNVRKFQTLEKNIRTWGKNVWKLWTNEKMFKDSYQVLNCNPILEQY